MATLLSLAPELHYAIALWLDFSSRKTMRLVCLQMSDAVEPLLFASITLSQIKSLDEVGSSFTPILARSCRELVLGSTKKPEIDNALYPVLSALTNLSSLTYFSSAEHTDKLHSILTNYPNIEHLVVSLAWGHTTMSALQIKGLRSLTIQGIDGKELSIKAQLATEIPFIPAFARVIAHSPKLQTLDISASGRGSYRRTPSLHEFLPVNHSGLPIQRLHLLGVHLQADEVTFLHLTCLKSLSFLGSYGGCLGLDRNMWHTFKRKSIFHEEIELNLINVNNKFLDYITSYTGLRKLVLDNNLVVDYDSRSSRSLPDDDELISLATRFFEEVIPCISSTIEILEIKGTRLRGWNVYTHNYHLLFPCKGLKKLVISAVAFGVGPESRKAMILKKLKDELPIVRRLEYYDSW